MSYGWSIGSPGQGNLPAPGSAPRYDQQQPASMGQTLYPTLNQPSPGFMGGLGIGWQQAGPPQQPGMAFGGGFNPAPMQPAAPAGAFGFGFAPAMSPSSQQYSNGPSAPAPSTPPRARTEPSAPPSAGDHFYSPRGEEDRRPHTDSTPQVVPISKPEKPDRPPAPKVVLVSDPTSSKSTLDTPTSDGSDRRNTSQYKEALQNMAALMTDVDLTDDVMNDLKQRFDLK